MGRLRDGRILRALSAAAGTAAFIAIAIAVNGSISFHIATLHVRAHRVTTAAVAVLALSLLTIAVAERGALRMTLSWWWTALERKAHAAALILAVLALIIGINWGTSAAGGSDSYCYLNQAELFARGEVRDVEPLATDPSWPGSPAAFVPAGHSATPGVPGGFVPICPAGYPLLLAGARLLGGRAAMFIVTPLFGALAVWLAFVLGRRLAGPPAGALAAALALTSPIFLYQVVQPMNDVVATSLWMAALALALRPGCRDSSRAVGAGLLCGAAVTVRPNLVPLAAVVAFCAASSASRDDARGARAWLERLVFFGVAAAPGVAVVLAAQNAIYGSPLKSGYGDLGALFSISHVVPNLLLYARWTVGAHTPLIIAGLAAPVLVVSARREAAWLLAFAAATLACYLPYVVFDAWWYQRFLLPGILPVLVLTAAVIVHVIGRLAPAPRMLAFALVCGILPVWYLHTAVRRDAFRLRELESRFRTAGEYAARLPPESAFITAVQSGSVRFYSGRTSATWGDIEPGRLADALAFFRRHGRKPYVLLEASEEPAFRERFAAEPLGRLEWPPVVEIDRAVRIYDPEDHERYVRGEYVKSERVISRQR